MYLSEIDIAMVSSPTARPLLDCLYIVFTWGLCLEEETLCLSYLSFKGGASFLLRAYERKTLENIRHGLKIHETSSLWTYVGCVSIFACVHVLTYVSLDCCLVNYCFLLYYFNNVDFYILYISMYSELTT